MNEPVCDRRIFSKEELLGVSDDRQIVATHFQIFSPEVQDLSIALYIIGKIAKAWLSGCGVFRMVFQHPQNVTTQTLPFRGCFRVRAIVPDENKPLINLV